MIDAILKRFANGFEVTAKDVENLFAAIERAGRLGADAKAKRVPDFTVEELKALDMEMKGSIGATLKGIAARPKSISVRSKSESIRLAEQTGDVFAELSLSVRTSLRNAGIYTVRDLAKCTRKYLLSIGISNIRQQEVSVFLKKRGFKLAEK